MLKRFHWKDLDDVEGYDCAKRLVTLLSKLGVLGSYSHGFTRKLGTISDLTIGFEKRSGGRIG